jgi:alpha-L-fucosidase
LGFGIYLSPWDMNSPHYGTDMYNDMFVSQLTELLTLYGEVDEVWFDGACGEGSNGMRQIYDWDRYYATVRKLQPGAVIAVRGPDVRWVGTESGYGRETEWSVIPVSESDIAVRPAASVRGIDSLAFLPPGDMMDRDLGSREKLYGAEALVWYPSEVDVSIRPGWFYHQEEDDRVKSPSMLTDIYFASVGRNSVLLLNVPPDRRGLIHENDIRALLGMREQLDSIFDNNLVADAASIEFSSGGRRRSSEAIWDQHNGTYWSPSDRDREQSAEITWEGDISFSTLMLQENYRNGQKVESFVLEVLSPEGWRRIAAGTTIGYRRLLRFSPVTTQAVRIRITGSRARPEISAIGIYGSRQAKMQ